MILSLEQKNNEMNKIYKILIIVVLGANTTPIWSQCTDQDISTHPSSAVNTLDPDKTNHFFDWEADVFQINSSLSTTGTIESPFDQLSNSNVFALRVSLDRLHQDGWELIDYDFGYKLEKKPLTGEVSRVNQSGNGVVNPFFILYNKYTGVMRIFVAIGQQFAGYSSAEFTLQVNSEKQPSVLNDRNVLMPLDDFVRSPTVKAVSTFINEAEKWFYADFLTQYDPCVCNFPSTMQLTVKLIDEAKITLHTYVDKKIVMPGSDNMDFSLNDRPYYNKPMGIFNLTETPQIYVRKNEIVEGVQWGLSFSFDDMIKYVVNYGAGFKELNYDNNLMGEFIFEFDSTATPLYELNNNMVSIGGQFYKSRLSPISCIGEVGRLDFGFRYTESDRINDKVMRPILISEKLKSVHLKLYVNLQRKDANANTQNVLYVGTYPVKTQVVNWTFPPSSFTGIEEEVLLENTVLTSDIRAWGNITIGDNVTIQSSNPSTPIKLISGGEIIIKPNSNSAVNILQNVELSTDLFASCQGTNPPLSEAEITSFCSSSLYNTEARGLKKKPVQQDNESLTENESFEIYPNPARDFVTVSYSLSEADEVNLVLTDLSGKTVQVIESRRLEEGNYQFQYETANLTAGVYFCTLMTSSSKTTKKIVIIK